MRFGDLVGGARAAIAAPSSDPAVHGLARLSGGMSHDVFAPIDDANLVVKVFRTAAVDESEHEWDALVALAGSGIAPEPVHFDAGDPAVVVMTRVPGSSLLAGALDAEDARVIGSVHRLVHRTVPRSRRRLPHSGIRTARAALMADEPHETSSRRDNASGVVTLAWRAAQTWIADVDIQHLLYSDDLRFCRGDPNLSNYLWSDEGLVLIDWENSGYSHPALELADMAEHASTRALSEDFWIHLADATELTQEDRARVTQARRLLSCFWLVLIESRQRQGLPTTVTLDEQASRTLAALEH
jgi:aminoglycoside phosphotransferase (APT) family kinase protein